MKRKTTTSILRRLLIILGAVLVLITLFACASNKSSSEPTISGIYASDVTIVYDGRPHSISVMNTLTTDTVLYSTDNITFSETAPAFVLPDKYTVYYKVNRSDYKEFASSATITILPCVLNDVYAENISVVYDGLPHSIAIVGLLNSNDEVVSYSTDHGLTFSPEIPTFTEVGVYTVNYSVERIVGSYKSSCTVTILPNVFGKYFNKTFGVVTLSQSSATVDSIDGSGHIGDDPFSVTDNVLSYKGLSFTLLSNSDYVYKLTAADGSVYFCAGAAGKLSISFADGAAAIKLGNETLLSAPNYNYCDSGEITDYVDLCFEQAFEYYTNITDVNVSLSNRTANPITFDCEYVTYDGLPHGFDFSVPVEYLSEQTMFTEVGKHTVSVAVISDEFLPLVIDCTIVILPDLTGVYATSEHVIQISDGTIEFDGVDCGVLSVIGDDWAWNDLPITVTESGIVYDGETYTATNNIILVVRLDSEAYSLLRLPKDADQLEISYDGTTLRFALENETLLDIPLNCECVTISLKDTPLPSLVPNETDTFMLGYADLYSNVVIINIKTV